jgi:hypothetical protein
LLCGPAHREVERGLVGKVERHCLRVAVIVHVDADVLERASASSNFSSEVGFLRRIGRGDSPRDPVVGREHVGDRVADHGVGHLIGLVGQVARLAGQAAGRTRSRMHSLWRPYEGAGVAQGRRRTGQRPDTRGDRTTDELGYVPCGGFRLLLSRGCERVCDRVGGVPRLL